MQNEMAIHQGDSGIDLSFLNSMKASAVDWKRHARPLRRFGRNFPVI